MHTSALKSCRIHHNSGYEGIIYITNEDSTSIPIDQFASIQFTYHKLVNCYKHNMGSNNTSVTIRGKNENAGTKFATITILLKDIETLIQSALLDKIENKLSEATFNNTLTIANMLNIKW